MSITPTAITLQTNLRKLELASDLKLQGVLHCQVDVQHDADIVPKERVPETEHKIVRSATMKYIATPECILSSINERQAVLLTIYNGQDEPPEALAELDYAAVCASGGPTPNTVFETKASKFERNYSSEEEYRWFSTQIITSNVSRAELSAALQRIALATNLASDGLASVYCHGLVVKCQALEVVRLLPSVATGEDFVDSSAGIKIPWAGSNKLILSLMSPPVPPTTSKCVQHSDGLKLLPGTSPSLYLNGAPRTFIAERPHVFVITDPRLHTITDLLDEQLGSEPSMKALLDPFLESIKSSPRDLTILRTGYLVDGSATSDSSFTSKARRLLMERNDIAKAYANIPKHGAFKYATLSEDKFLKVTASDQDCTPHGNNRTPLLITKLDAREVAGQSSFWVFHDKKTADSTTGIKVTFLPEVDPSISSQTTNGTDSVGKQHEHDTGLSQTAHDVPTEPRVSHVLSGLIKPPPSPLQEPRSPPAPSNHPAAEVASPEEVDILGRIWMDDHLELYDIKWPTPTNLAQLALKRAQMHLVSNDWDNRLQGQTAPVFLPEVHENVRNTLYYT